jgi:imidazolonepropionase-like amidohydrolase
MTRPIQLAIVAWAVLAAPMAAQDLVLTNARILDPASRTELYGSVWIEDGRIVGSGPQPPVEAAGQRIDLGGQWVIPGLVDLHTHSFGNAAPGRVTDGGGTARTSTRVLRAGVVAFLDLFGAEDYILQLRDQQREEAGDGAYIFAAGPCFTAPRGHCSEYGIPTRTVSTPAEARQQVIEVAAKRPDVIKIVYDHVSPSPNAPPSIDRATLRAIIATATAFGVPTVVHVGSWEDVRHAALAGATAVTHVPRDGIAPDDVVSLMAASRISHIPTLVVHSDLAEFVDNPALMDDPLVRALAADTIRATYRRGASHFDEPTRRWLDVKRTLKADAFESVRRLHAAGVPMLVGSDAGNWGVIQGYSVHREMIRLVEAGLSPWDALKAGSTSAAAFLGRRFGVRPGDEAHLVVLDASPLEQIENTQRITYVIQRGRVVYRR